MGVMNREQQSLGMIERMELKSVCIFKSPGGSLKLTSAWAIQSASLEAWGISIFRVLNDSNMQQLI
jgi:hypothetical protein